MNEQQVQRLATALKWGLGLVAAAIIAPLVFLAIQGLIGLAIAGILGLAIVNGAPWFSMKFANWKLRAIKHEARTNPVETLQNELVKKREALAQFADSITAFATEVGNFTTKVEQFKREHPEQAAVFEQQLAGMKDLLEARRRRYKEADRAVDQFEAEISRASALWDMSQAAQKMNRVAGKQAEDVFAQIKRDTALDSVQTSLNRAFAELETSLLIESQPGAPLLEPAVTINGHVLAHKEIAR